MRSLVVPVVALSLLVPPSALAAGKTPDKEKEGASPAASATATPAPVAATAVAPPRPSIRSDEAVTPSGALWRSTVIPGWGQRYKGEKAKGWIFTGVAAGLAAGTVGSYLYAKQAHADYERLGPNDSAGTFQSKYNSSVNAAVGFDFVAASTAAFWLYNMSDTLFTPLEHLRIKDARIKDVFPAQYKYYEANPFASIAVENRSNEPVNKVKLKIEAKDIMDLPAESSVVETIPPGLGKSLDVTAAFNDRIFEIGQSEPRAIPAKVTIEYEVGNKKRKIEHTATFTVYNRNAIVWDDMRKLASFVTPREDSVKQFSAQVTRALPNPVSSVASLARAAALFDAVTAAGIKYQSDPSAPFTYFEGNAEAVDTVSFPRETLTRKTGDCDDLTSLYASLLENSGIPTGLVDVPGHVFVMFDSGLTGEEIKRYAPADVSWQMRDGTAWIPVEITDLGKPFHQAWADASGEYKKWEGLNKFHVVETETAQEQFPPSPPKFAPLDEKNQLAPLDGKQFMALASNDHGKLSHSERGARDQAIAAIKARHLPPAAEFNEVGIVYAKDSMLAEAEAQFRRAVAADPRLAKAHNNLANVLYLENKPNDARGEYEKALETGGENAAVLANLASLYYDAGKADQAKDFMQRALRIEPGYARDYPEIAALVHGPDASGGALASAGKKPNGMSKASNIGAGEKDPRRSRWIP